MEASEEGDEEAPGAATPEAATGGGVAPNGGWKPILL